MNPDLYYFFVSAFFGVIGGFPYELERLFRRKGKRVFPVFYFCFLFLLSTFGQILFRFPSYRIYFGVGTFLGFTVYLKSIHRILDFFLNFLYNKTKSNKKVLYDGRKD